MTEKSNNELPIDAKLRSIESDLAKEKEEKPAEKKVEPKEPTATEKKVNSTPPKQTSVQSKPSSFPLTLLYILWLVSVAAAGYWYLMIYKPFSEGLESRLQQQQISTQQQLTSSIEERLTSASSGVQSQQQQLAAQLSDVQQRLTQLTQDTSSRQRSFISEQNQILSSMSTQLQQTNAQVNKILGRNNNDWLLAEANYLTQMAARAVWVERNVPGAIAMLQIADQKLASMKDASLMTYREQILADMQMLQGLPSVDVETLILKIGSLVEAIDTLKISSVYIASDSPQMDTSISASSEDWQDNLLKGLDSFFTIHKSAKVRAHMPPQQQWYVRENIKRQLLVMQQSVVKELPKAYVASANQSIIWVQQYFDKADEQVAAYLSTLRELSTETISIQYPSELGSVAALKELADSRLNRVQ